MVSNRRGAEEDFGDHELLRCNYGERVSSNEVNFEKI
jgi:hypothetical protein